MNEPNIPYHLDRRQSDYPKFPRPKYGWRDDNGTAIHAIREDGTPICGRIRNRTKLPCQSNIVCPNGRCNAPGHGGQSPGMPIKHGRYSIYLPTRLAAKYEAAINDDVLEYLRENVAIVVAMTQGKFEEFDQNTSAELWKNATAAVRGLRKAVLENNPARIKSALAALEEVLKNGSGQQQKEAESLKLMTEAARLGKAELARLHKLGQFITPHEAMANQAHLLTLLRKYVKPTDLHKLSKEISSSTVGRFG